MSPLLDVLTEPVEAFLEAALLEDRAPVGGTRVRVRARVRVWARVGAGVGAGVRGGVGGWG